MLQETDRIYLDSNTIIAIVEVIGGLSEAQLRFINGIDNGRIDCLSSDLALAECLVLPFRLQDNGKVADMLTFFGEGDVLPIIPFNRSLFLKAAEIRAVSNIKMPDAMHIACATVTNCTVFMSSDAGVKLPAGMRRISFQELTL